jgi:PadR family transcriptional regulator, regulatory protein PadR
MSSPLALSGKDTPRNPLDSKSNWSDYIEVRYIEHQPIPSENMVARTLVEIQNLTRICNEMLILTVLGEGKLHGYELALNVETRSSGFFTFKHGTLYPILHKLESDGLIKGTWKKEKTQRKRKYYTLTPRGRRRIIQLRLEWIEFNQQLMAMGPEVEA